MCTILNLYYNTVMVGNRSKQNKLLRIEGFLGHTETLMMGHTSTPETPGKSPKTFTQQNKLFSLKTVQEVEDVAANC
jgi:hypothetical protein